MVAHQHEGKGKGKGGGFRTNLEQHLQWFEQNKGNLKETHAAMFDFAKVGTIFEAKGPLICGTFAELKHIVSKVAQGASLSAEMKIPRAKMQPAKVEQSKGARPGEVKDMEDILGGNKKGKGKGTKGSKGNKGNKGNDIKYENEGGIGNNKGGPTHIGNVPFQASSGNHVAGHNNQNQPVNNNMQMGNNQMQNQPWSNNQNQMGNNNQNPSLNQNNQMGNNNQHQPWNNNQTGNVQNQSLNQNHMGNNQNNQSFGNNQMGNNNPNQPSNNPNQHHMGGNDQNQLLNNNHMGTNQNQVVHNNQMGNNPPWNNQNQESTMNQYGHSSSSNQMGDNNNQKQAWNNNQNPPWGNQSSNHHQTGHNPNPHQQQQPWSGNQGGEQRRYEGGATASTPFSTAVSTVDTTAAAASSSSSAIPRALPWQQQQTTSTGQQQQQQQQQHYQQNQSVQSMVHNQQFHPTQGVHTVNLMGINSQLPGLHTQHMMNHNGAAPSSSSSGMPPAKKQRTKEPSKPDPNMAALCKPFINTSKTIDFSSLCGQQLNWQVPCQWDDAVNKALSGLFGISHFRPLQREIVNASIANKDVFVRMPTGGGKSLTYQLPPLVTERLAIIVSPLISLMQDQLMSLDELGVPCGMISSQNERNQNDETYRKLSSRELLLLYVTPELIARSGKLQRMLLDMGDYVGRFVIDEAHCLSQWGYDFRDSYLELNKLRTVFPRAPILCCSATATDEVMSDVIQCLQMSNTQVFKTQLNRPNLEYMVLVKKKTKINEQIVDFIKQRIQGTGSSRTPSGIIYCLARRECEKVAEELSTQYGLKCAYYHAEANLAYREEVQTRWMRNEIPIIVSTVAFGMGINKPDVEFVIHQTMPKTLEGYYQESGRAGRNGVKSICVIFYDYNDKSRLENMCTNETQRYRLLDMVQYCQTMHMCRRTMLEQYFDAQGGLNVACDLSMEMCDNCVANQSLSWEATDVTREVQSICELVVKSNKRLTLIQLKDILAGSTNRKSKNLGNNIGVGNAGNLFGKGSSITMTGDEIIRLLRHLCCIKVLAEELVKNDNVQYAGVIGYMILGPNPYQSPIYFPRKKTCVAGAIQQPVRPQMTQMMTQIQNNGLQVVQALELKRRLKMLVDDISQREGRCTAMGCIPQVGLDRLVEMCPLPRSLEDLAAIKTFTLNRIQAYGMQVLECLRQFLIDFNCLHLAEPHLPTQNNVLVTEMNYQNGGSSLLL